MRRYAMVALAAAPFALVAVTQAMAGATDNKAIVRDFYDKGLNQKDFAAASRYFGPTYTQHNPMAPEGIEGFKGLVEILRTKVPQFHCDFVRVLADGDYVVMHNRCSPAPGGPQSGVVDIFRLDHGKIVEHWDVSQPVPAHSANGNTMF